MAGSGVEMTGLSGEGFEFALRHGPSGATLATQPPKDNGGTGAAFSPTDLVGAALMSCALTTMSLAAKREGVAWGATSARVEKRMQAEPRRIAQLTLDLRMPPGLTGAQRQHFEQVATQCPVARSLHPDVRLPMTFTYPD